MLAGMGKEAEFPVAEYVRQARRRASANQRELAERAEMAQSTVARIEAGQATPCVPTFHRLLRAAGLHLAVVDDQGYWVPPLQEPPDTRDLAERRFPAHLGLILDPEPADWWGSRFGLIRPPETFHRDPEARRAHRELAHHWRGVACHPIKNLDWRQGTQLRSVARWELPRPPWAVAAGED